MGVGRISGAASSPQPEDLGVDIVISNHNYGVFLRDAIESARGQSHPNTKVIVVDDGSTDDSRDLLRAFEGEVDVVLKENGGQASALNAGLERSHGEIVLFLDADDVLRPRATSCVADAFAADPRLSRVQFSMAVIDAAGQPTGAMKPSRHLRPLAGDLRRAELTFPFDIPLVPTSGNAFRADLLRGIFPIPERDFRHCADWYVVHLTTLLGRVGSIDEVCGRYRVHGRNAYELEHPRLELRRVRDSIAFAGVTAGALLRLADQIGQERPERILSVSDLGNRLISLRLDPERHPVPGDQRWRLVGDGLLAARRRFDVGWPMKLMFSAWFVAVAISPRPVVRRLAELLLFPRGRRSSLNRLLGRLRRRGRRGGEG